MASVRTSGKLIAVIGAGISGLTTAVHLQEVGYRTTIYSPLVPHQVLPEEPDPSFATLYPAACIIPHSVEMPDLVEVFSISQEVFASLSGLPDTGIRWQTHYEFGDGPDFPDPEFRRVLRNFRRLEAKASTLPFHSVLSGRISGWGASILFAEMRFYLRYLLRRYHSYGGVINHRGLHLESLADLPVDGIVNCTGLWARGLFSDQSLHPVRGILVLLEGAPFPPQNGEPVVSYNYSPSPDVYRYDVYFFPRTDGWLLGGSREIGSYGPDGTAVFPPLEVDLTDGIPAPIIDLNRKLLMELTGLDLMRFRRRSFAGFRPGRIGGVRLGTTTEFARPVIHNYGHGGAGVALSWGCAHRVEGLLAQVL